MRPALFPIFALLLLATACTRDVKPEPTPPEEAPVRAPKTPEHSVEALAITFVNDLSVGRTQSAWDTFDETMRGAMPLEGLSGLWGKLQGQLGPFQGHDGAESEPAGPDHTAVFVHCVFGKNAMDMKLIYDKESRVAGLFVVPPRPKGGWAPPEYAKEVQITEEEVTFGPAPWTLPGTLSLPIAAKGPLAAVVLVHGSGPNDRDETVGASKPFKDLAWGLSTMGFAVLRYDKRTKVHGPKLAAVERFTIQQETIEDAVLAGAFLRKDARIDPKRVFVLGHSLGATVIGRILAQDKAWAGGVALAPLARPLEEVMVEQFTHIFSADGAISDEEQVQLDTFKVLRDKIKSLTKANIDDKAPIFGAPAAYWLDIQNADFPADALAAGQPILVLQGERDYQVTMDNFELWKKGLASHKAAQLKSYPALNHLFIAGEGPSVPTEYQTPGHVAAEVVADIAAWMKLR